ncbi:MAG: class I SAM-dependent methyltransferase [Spirochaetota bacterium]|nr:class I SAM-dependent methyltransferase [Spirochaetota bacterium]
MPFVEKEYTFSDSSIYSQLKDHCPLCGGKEIELKYIIDKYNPFFRVDRCRLCGFIFMNPAFQESIIEDFYSEDYYKCGRDYSYYDERELERYAGYVWEKRIEIIRGHAAKGNLLDIGSAFGGFLKLASQYFSPYGIELSEYAGTYAKGLFGNNIHIGSLYDNPFKEKFFSVITMIELIEHLADPVTAIRECYRLLKGGGLLVIQTANMDGLQARVLGDRYAYYMPVHLSYFTKKNLTSLLKWQGFSRIITFHPVEFGLLPKLLKSRYYFKSYTDYHKWFRISFYHYISKIRYRDSSITSSMVIYAFK